MQVLIVCLLNPCRNQVEYFHSNSRASLAHIGGGLFLDCLSSPLNSKSTRPDRSSIVAILSFACVLKRGLRLSCHLSAKRPQKGKQAAN